MARELVVAGVRIPAGDLSVRAVRSSGPGGQNVNKVSSKVELRFDLRGTAALTDAVRARLRVIARNRLDADGCVVVTSQLSRDRTQNQEDAFDKLAALIARALVVPTKRRATRPSRAARERRLGDKRKQSSKKAARRGRPEE